MRLYYTFNPPLSLCRLNLPFLSSIPLSVEMLFISDFTKISLRCDRFFVCYGALLVVVIRPLNSILCLSLLYGEICWL